VNFSHLFFLVETMTWANLIAQVIVV